MGIERHEEAVCDPHEKERRRAGSIPGDYAIFIGVNDDATLNYLTF
jgi:hypothetical protein